MTVARDCRMLLGRGSRARWGVRGRVGSFWLSKARRSAEERKIAESAGWRGSERCVKRKGLREEVSDGRKYRGRGGGG